jgi:hypothetical protein
MMQPAVPIGSARRKSGFRDWRNADPLDATPRELGSLLAVRISRSTELYIKLSRCRYCGGIVRSPHALVGHMAVQRPKSKEIPQCSNNLW